MLYGWNVDSMPTFNIFRVRFLCFSISGWTSSKKSKCTKNTKWSQKLLKFCDVPLKCAYWTHKKYGVQISSKKMKSLCNRWVFVRTLILRKRLSVCTRSASSFCRNPLNFLAHAMWVKWWYHASFLPFQSSFVVLFNFRVI